MKPFLAVPSAPAELIAPSSLHLKHWVLRQAPPPVHTMLDGLDPEHNSLG